MLSTLPVSIIGLIDANSITNTLISATSEEEPQENETFEMTIFFNNESDSNGSMSFVISKIAFNNAFDYSDVLHDIIIPPPDFS